MDSMVGSPILGQRQQACSRGQLIQFTQTALMAQTRASASLSVYALFVTNAYVDINVKQSPLLAQSKIVPVDLAFF